MFSKSSGSLSKKSKQEGKNYYHVMIIYFHAKIIYFHVKIIYFHVVKKVFSLSSVFFGEGKKLYGEGKTKDIKERDGYVCYISAEEWSRALTAAPRWCFSFLVCFIPLCWAKRVLG